MQNDLRVFLAGILLASIGTHTCNAQKNGPVSSPRYYVGVHQLYRIGYQVFYSNTPGAVSVHPWQITLGLNASPRLALQLGVSYTTERNQMDPAYTGTMLNGDYVDGATDSRQWTYCVPVLARYAMLRYPKPRFQVDGILGLTLLGTSYTESAEDRVNGRVVRSYYDEGKATQLYATVGLGLRCPFGRHFEGVFDWTYNRNFQSASEYVNFNTTGNRYGFTRAISLGLRYRFDVKKKRELPADS